MGRKNYYAAITVAIIFIFVLSIRIFMAYQTPHFNDGEAYWNLMQVEHIKENGLPMFYDDLSYGGRDYIFSPLFHYLLAFFNLFLPITLVGKIIPNLIASSLVIIIYYIAKEISTDYVSAIFAAIVSGFISIFMSSTVNTVSVYSLFFPMSFLAIFCFLRINHKKYAYAFIMLIFLLTLTHQGTIVLIAGLLVYLALLKLESIENNQIEMQIILFSTFLFIWLQLIFFKKMLIFHGPAIIWQNIPTEILSNYYSDTTLLTILLSIGTIPLMYGIYATYHYLFKIKDSRIYLLIGFAMTVSVFLWLKIVEPLFGMIALGIVTSILFSLFYLHSWDYLKKTRFDKYKKLILITFFIALTLTVIIPTLYNSEKKIEESITDDEIEALIWIRENTPETSIVLSAIDEGNLITAIAERQNVADNHYMMVHGTEQYYKDIKIMFATVYKTSAMTLMDKYEVDYILFTDNVKKDYGIEDLTYTHDERCFEEVYSNEDSTVFQLLCEMK